MSRSAHRLLPGAEPIHSRRAMPFLRLRQICLVAHELEPVVDDLCAVLGLQVCHRDPSVERFGLHNALMRVGSSFIEVVAPIRDGTAAGRHLARGGGDCGYMVILDCDDLTPWRKHVAKLGVREASWLEVPGYTGLQLHPRDTGGALLEINHTPGGESLAGPYWPAGPHWQDLQGSDVALAMTGATLSSNDPGQLVGRWAKILQRDRVLNALELDNARLSFLPTQVDDHQGLTGVDLNVADVAKVIANARIRSCETTDDAVAIGGIWWQLSQGTCKPAGLVAN